MQETFARFYVGYLQNGRIDGKRSPWPLLVTIATREALRRNRKDARRREIETRAVVFAPARGVDLGPHAAVELAAEVVCALESLPARQRRVFVQSTLHPTWAVAAAEGVTVAAVRQVVMRARRNLVRHFSDDARAGHLIVLPWVRISRLVARCRSRLGNLARLGEVTVSASAAMASIVVALSLHVAAPSVAVAVGPATLTTPASVPSEEPSGAVATSRPPSHPRLDRPGGRNLPQSQGSPPSREAGRVTVERSVTVSDPGGESRSLRTLEVRCDRGLAASKACDLVDLVPSSAD